MKLIYSQSLSVVHFRTRSLLRRLGWRLRDRISAPSRQAPLPVPRRTGPLRVGFVVCMSSKWALQSILEELQAQPDVECGIYITLSDLSLRYTPAKRRQDYRTQRAFFSDRAPIWADLYDLETDRIQPLSLIDCDIIFIQQPWGMQDLPRRLSGRVRCAYVHYGVPVIANERMHYGLPDFHPFLWRYFVPTSVHAQALSSSGHVPPEAVRIVGHPKLDIYQTPSPERNAVTLWAHPEQRDRQRVIYAPHHGLGAESLKLGTFDWSGATMLALTRKFRNVDFILRPHPNLGYELMRGGMMSHSDWQQYLDDWRHGENTSLSLDGDYFDLFRTSDALITDSGSFLAEYLPTGKPLIRLTRSGSTPLNQFGMSLSAGFCEVQESHQLEQLFETVIVRGVNPCAAHQARLMQLLLPYRESAAGVIVTDLLNGTKRG